MFTYSDNTVSIILLFQFICDFIYSAIIHDVSDVSNDLYGIRAEYSADHSALDETAGICSIPAVVDTRSLAGARNHCEGSVCLYRRPADVSYKKTRNIENIAFDA
jgi:hypothetical protein